MRLVTNSQSANVCVFVSPDLPAQHRIPQRRGVAGSLDPVPRALGHGSRTDHSGFAELA